MKTTASDCLTNPITTKRVNHYHMLFSGGIHVASVPAGEPRLALFAAAPEMLEALTALVTYTEACEGMLNVTPSGQVKAAREAIAHATAPSPAGVRE